MGSSLTKGTVRVQVRKDTASNLASANPTLAAGEFGFETDGTLKIGDGSTAWTALSYVGFPYHYMQHQWDATSTSDYYVPFGASITEYNSDVDSLINDNVWIVPFAGKLVKAYLYCESATGDTDMKLNVNGSLGSSVLSGGVVAVASKTVATFTCDQNNTFSAGDVIRIFLDITAKSDDATMTTVWQRTA